MKNQLLKITALSAITSSVLMASGYKIPETSMNSVALSGANIAHVKEADAAYDNPANMVFMGDNNHMEVNLMYIGTSGTKYKGSYAGEGSYDISAEEQTFIIPSLHYVSPSIGDIGARFGLSMVVPGGLTREWKEQPAQATAEEFTLQIVEVNPTVALNITDEISAAIGFRVVHSSGVVKSSSAASRDMEGNSIDYGYNIALSYKPTNNIDIGVTYRSNIDLTIEGNAKLSIGDARVYNGGTSLTVPLPAALNLAAAYTFATKTTVEVVYEKTYWSTYEAIDFNYVSSIPSILVPSFDNPVPRNWKDSQSLRLGITQELENLTLMAGFVMDETPTPEKTLGYESPGSDSISMSFGTRYKINNTIDVGIGALYSMKEDRTVKNANIDGEFSNSNALLISAALGYKF